jgi:hypothetical protein
MERGKLDAWGSGVAVQMERMDVCLNVQFDWCGLECTSAYQGWRHMQGWWLLVVSCQQLLLLEELEL